MTQYRLYKEIFKWELQKYKITLLNMIYRIFYIRKKKYTIRPKYVKFIK